MKQIKKLARRGMAQTLALLAAIFFGVTAVFGLIMLGEGVEQALMMVVAMVLMFGIIMLIFVLIGSVPYLRIGKMIKRQCEDLGIELNEETVEVFVDGAPVRLTPIEFKILLLLMRNPGRVFSADEIYERIWNEKAVNTDTIMVHVRKIREKIEIDPKNPKYLKVVWGVGYKMEKQ